MIRLTEKQKSYINNLQNNLGLIIAIMGMSKEEFGSKIDITRQSIFNLISKKIKMNKTQYIAIRRIIDFYIENDNSPIDLNRLSLSQIIPFKYILTLDDYVTKSSSEILSVIICELEDEDYQEVMF